MSGHGAIRAGPMLRTLYVLIFSSNYPAQSGVHTAEQEFRRHFYAIYPDGMRQHAGVSAGHSPFTRRVIDAAWNWLAPTRNRIGKIPLTKCKKEGTYSISRSYYPVRDLVFKILTNLFNFPHDDGNILFFSKPVIFCNPSIVYHR